MAPYSDPILPVAGPAARARRYARASAARPLPPEDGYCRLFSLDWWLICIAIFALIFVAGGDVSVVAYLAACSLVALRNPGLAWRALVRNWPLLLLPALCMFSVLWSVAPDVSRKQGAELLATCVLAIVIIRRVTVRELAAALLVAGSLMCVLCLLYQRNALNVALVGLTGSKNWMAYVSQVLLISAVTVAMDASHKMRLRVFAVGGAILGGLCLALAQSAGAWVTSAAAIAALLGLSFFSRISFGVRVVLVALGLLMLLPIVFAYQDVVEFAQTVQTQVFHKDATLTGRTELWTAAKSIISERPVLGDGYSAFWQPDNVDAQALFRTTAAHVGFNFHNQFLDTEVDLGLVGLVFLVAALTYVAAGAIWRATTKPSLAAAFMASLVMALYIRLPVESTLLGAWTIYTFLWLSVGVNAYARGDQPSQVPAETLRQGPSRRPYSVPRRAMPRPATRAQM